MKQNNIKKWDNLEYQKIVSANLSNGHLIVQFENGDKIELSLSILVSKDLSKSKIQVFHNSYEVIIELDTDTLEVPWDKIRAITDKEYSKFLAEEAEQEAKSIGIKIKRLREKRNIKSNELADLAGVTPQTISRIEKGHTDLSFATLKKILSAMGYSLKDLADQEEKLELERNPRSLDNLLRKLARAGIDSKFFLKRIIPPKISNSIFSLSEVSDLMVDEISQYLSKIFEWTDEQIWGTEELNVDNSAFQFAFYKTPSRVNLSQIKAYSHYAYYLSKAAIKAYTPSKTQADYPGDIEEFKDRYFSKYTELDFEALLTYIWDLGICVLPLNDSGLFHGASWNIEGRHVIVLKQTNQVHARWIFDLLHEVYHILAHLDTPNTSVIETEELTPILDNASEEELEANAFANQVIFGKRAEELAMLCVEMADYQLENLKSTVSKVAKREGVRVDFLANYLAFRLQLQKQNWWGTASNMQITNPSPIEIAARHFKARVSFDKLNPIDANLLQMALNNN